MSKKPALIAYSVREREGQKAVWTRIGAAWPHGNGPGFTIQLEALIGFYSKWVILAQSNALGLHRQTNESPERAHQCTP